MELRKAKVADRPHTTSIVLSALALLVSLYSIFISWRVLQLNRVSARAVVEITQLRYRLAELPENFWKTPDVRKAQKFFKEHPPILEGTISNFGKTRALNIKVSGQIRLWGTNSTAVAQIESFSVPDLAPGRTQNAYVKPNMYASFSPIPDNIRMSGFLDYTDEATGAVYHESWCYQSKQTKPVVEFAFCSADAPPGPTLGKAPEK